MANSTKLTEDGVEVAYGGFYWLVNVNHLMTDVLRPQKVMFTPRHTTMSVNYKVFALITEANKYIIKNKPDNVPYYDED